jgi:PAS domain S-box-containing protein
MVEPRGRVLVVDDSEDDHLQIRRLLRDEFEVFRAYTGAEALERIEREQFDALITDQKMPRMSGADLIERIHAHAQAGAADAPRLRSILLSGRTSDEQLVAILREGHVFRYFEKDRALLSPDGRTEFVQAVRHAVQSGRLEQDHQALNERLRGQNAALESQYELLRALVDVREPTRVLQLVVESLVQRVACRGIIGLVDLRPSHGVLGYVQVQPDGARLSSGELDAWLEYAQTTCETLSGRALGPVEIFGRPELPAGESQLLPNDHAALLPVFVSRDLRGVVVLIRSPDEPLLHDEAGLLRIWRDQLQDALTRVHTRLLDEQRRIELMVETMAEGVVLTDEEGAVTLINPTARRILSLREVDRPDFSKVVTGMGLSTLDVLRQLGVGESKVAWRELHRGEAYYHVLFSQVRDHAGRFVGILTVIRDVSDEKLAEQRREEFVHIIGHELRSPLTSIGGILDLLGKQVLGEMSSRQRDYIEMAKDSCVRINHILNDLLDLAKFEKGKMPLSLETMNLETVVADTVRTFGAVAIKKGVELTFDCILEGLSCQADLYRLGQVMNNLLSNALKFTPEGGTVRVTVFTTFSAPNLYVVSVHNTGEEIAPADLDRIFDKFEQVAMQDRRSIGGTGLGLSICRNIVQGHQGEIWVESGQGDGTRFVFSLPCGPTPSRRREGTGARDPRTILLVGEDLQEVLGLKGLLLELDLYRIRVCRAEVQAVRTAMEAHKPDIALYLDVDGTPISEVLDELASHTEVPVVGILPPGTTVPSTVDTVLELPAETTVLSSVLNVVLSRRQQQRRMRLLMVGTGTVSDFCGPLDEAGYLPYPAQDVDNALRRLEALLPDLVVLDLSMTGVDRVLAYLHQKAEGGSGTAALYVGSDAQLEAHGLSTDDRLASTLSPRQLVIEVRTRLTRDRRSGLDTLMVLPGARELQREVQGRMRAGEPYAYGAIDITGLAEAIEARGFMWGHATMAHTAELIHNVLQEHADDRAFLGHQRDDDFVFLVRAADVTVVCEEVLRAFARLEPIILADEAGTLGLSITAIVDRGGRFERFPALQAALSRSRSAAERSVIVIDTEA